MTDNNSFAHPSTPADISIAPDGPPLSPTPLPKRQLAILLYIQAAEPMATFVILPFINQLIYEYGMTNGDRKKVGYYVGGVNSLYYSTEMVCVYYWGRKSDRIGRRPIIITGLCGLILSISCFGLSKTFIALILSRALSGALDGNIGVIKSMMAELTDETNQAQAFNFTELVYAGGMGVASFIGGGLSHPYERFPSVFGGNQFWKNYPYALPCFVSASYCASAVITAFLFLKETLHSKSQKPAPMTSMICERQTPMESTVLLPKENPPPLRRVLTPRVRLAILNYGTLSLLNIMYTFLQPLFMSTPITLGGLGLAAPAIGSILGARCLLSGLFQALLFLPLHRRYGTKRVFIVTVLSYFPLYLAWPLMSYFARRANKVDAAVISVLILQQSIAAFAGMGFSCTNIFITSAAPSRNTLGTTTGMGQSFVALIRTIGPPAATSLFAVSVQHDLLGGQFVYLILVLVVSLSFLAAAKLPKVIKRASDE